MKEFHKNGLITLPKLDNEAFEYLGEYIVMEHINNTILKPYLKVGDRVEAYKSSNQLPYTIQSKSGFIRDCNARFFEYNFFNVDRFCKELEEAF